jgi:hypothetical protein
MALLFAVLFKIIITKKLLNITCFVQMYYCTPYVSNFFSVSLPFSLVDMPTNKRHLFSFAVFAAFDALLN